MNILFFDCFSGISGDMALAALLDLNTGNYDYLVSQLKTLRVDGWDITMERRDKNGINANYIKVALHDEHEHEHEHNHHHRNFADIVKIIDGSSVTDKAKALSKGIFKRIAAAEAKIHGGDIAGVNFHEVGAVDSIIDIVGAAALLDLIITQNKIEKIYCSTISDGHGFTHCQHGQIPVPAPATVEIFAAAGVKTKRIDIPKELVTPTGAAIIAEIADSFGDTIEMTALKTGYGAGTRELVIPNVLRVILGESPCPIETITVIETNIDDCSPEILAYTMEKLFEAGANDVFFTPVYMKKSRPAVKLTVLCEAAATAKLADIIFAETTSIGARIREEKRICLTRGAKTVKTRYGDLKVKEIEHNGGKKIFPEYESAKALANSAGVPLYKIYDSVKGE